MMSTSSQLADKRLNCRICKGLLFSEPLLFYANMPANAQGFPDADTLGEDAGADLEVCQCSRCGLVQLSNPPVPYYRDVIRAIAYSEDMREFRIQQLQAWSDKYHLTGRKVLEIGCGRGEYLVLLNAAGMHAHGIEHAQPAVEYCKQQGLKAAQGYLGEPCNHGDDTRFDGFASFNFMEHWPDPVSTLNALSAQLTDHAIGLIEVPNFDMMLKKGLFSEFIADHLLYFTKETLTLTLQANGFDLLECTSIWQDYILSAVVRKRAPTNLDFFKHYRHDICSQIHAYINRFPGGKVAIWGAGHQALAIIALAELAGKISYVIDSAPFKQGKYTPASHLPIVHPDLIKTDPPEAIIIMAAAYSDEVARTIRTNYGHAYSVAILRDFGLETV